MSDLFRFLRNVAITTFLILTGLTIVSHCARAESLDPARTVVISSVIARGNILALADSMEQMVARSKEPISIVINSPGGDVITGFAFINYMESLRAKGIRLDCYVPMMAASMAFQIFLHCDERTALSKAFLLWHGVRVQVGGGFGNGQVITADSAQKLATDLAALDHVIFGELLHALDMDMKDIAYHFNAETLHVASNLKELAPKFLDTPDYVPGLLEALTNPKIPHSNDAMDLEFSPGEITYIKGNNK